MATILATSPTQFMMVAQERYADAKALASKKRWSGAIYLAGYAIECSLKAYLCRMRREPTLSAQYRTHDLVQLRDAAVAIASDDLVVETLQTLPNWSSVYRYGTRSPGTSTVYDFVSQAGDILRCLSKQM